MRIWKLLIIEEKILNYFKDNKLSESNINVIEEFIKQDK
jgi:hypothetical protein